MKTYISKKKLIIAIAIVAAIAIALTSIFVLQKISNNKTHLILNNNGSYGGSLDEKLYGKGAPLNGEYDVKNSDYYTVNNDYYNMSSTEERVIFPKFASYQQTMQDSSGLACLMMVLNYMGEDVKEKYNELALVKKYEEVTYEKIYGNGASDFGLVSLIDSLGLGYTAEYQGFGEYHPAETASMKEFFIEAIKEGKFVFVRYQSPVGYKWKVVIGYDTLGNNKSGKDSINDDVIIFANPYDGGDHQQDGYSTERVLDFIAWWCEVYPNGIMNDQWSCVVVDPNLDIEFKYEPVDERVKQKLYDIHLPLNPDGTYGGTRNSELYGSVVKGNGHNDHINSNYYKINDFYNMGSEGSRVLLTNYTVLQQTIGYSCGICAANGVLKYYGHEQSQYDLELALLNQFEKVTGITVKGRGVTVNELHAALQDWGYKTEYNVSWSGKEPKFPTYESYMQFLRSNLEEGRPIVVTTYLGSDHAITVIGLDDMGTDYIYDDVIIVADSGEYWDGYQDGYNTHSAYKFFTQHTNTNHTQLQSYLLIYDEK